MDGRHADAGRTAGGDMRCDGCGFVYESVSREGVVSALRAFEARYAASLPDHDDLLRRRPEPGVWSAVEYACHVRDVLFVQRERALRALVEDTPALPVMHREERVEILAYRQETRAAVLRGIGVGAELLATVFERLSPDQLGRTMLYNFPDPAERDVLWLGRHTIHEGEHHVGDVEAVLARVAA